MDAVSHLAIAVTFFYKASRLSLLAGIASRFAELGDRVHAYVVTNTHKLEEKETIKGALRDKGVTFSLHTPKLLGHPYLLPWCHFDIFRQLFERDESVSHFLYLEDDMLLTAENIRYWLRGREELRDTGFYPSFLRYEVKEGDPTPYILDSVRQRSFETSPKVFVREDYCYVNLKSAYQAVYFLDRQLMREHLRGPSSNPDSRPWDIRASAAQGLSFLNIPEGFTMRNLVGFDMRAFLPDPGCLIHHTANNYADDPSGELGKIPLDKLIV